MDKQCALLYFSATDTTAQVVKAIGSQLGGDIKEYNLTRPQDRERDMVFGADDLVVVGVPVYGGRVPGFLADFFSRVQGYNTPAVFVVVYGNRHYDDALLELKDIFEQRGFIGIAGGTFIGEHSYTNLVATGRPDQNDLKIAAEFGSRVSAKLAAYGEPKNCPPLMVPGSYPYKASMAKMPEVPHVDEQCIECGICAEHCPMGAISWSNFRDIDASRCILCCSCQKRCPVGAISVHHPRVDKIRLTLIRNFGSVRKDPESFL